jgi:Tol biopolymer transport system component
MGEVYRAHDTTLGREVALKVLPDAVATDGERLARFEREARTLAALNHPHIAHVYGFEASGPMCALIMELVPGPTLAEHVSRGALPVDQAVNIARQIAEALDAAHGQNIVHRDLKPDNIKVRPDGTVKVLDFGLAKALDPQWASTPSRDSPTITSPAMLTNAGVILGTAAYMSPEQAQGRTADQQSDIWAFGCVLYEMLTGRRAFDGDDVAGTLRGVLRSEPDWHALPAGLPRNVMLVLRRSLARDRRDRLRHIGDAHLLLDDLHAAPEEAGAPRPPGLWHRPMVPWTLVAVLFASLVGMVFLVRPSTMPVPQITKFTVQAPAGVDLAGAGNQIAAVLSPDGRKLVFVAQQGGTQALWVREFGRDEPERLAGTDRALQPFWSPDSGSIGFFADDQLKTVSAAGGLVRPLCGVRLPRGATWNHDDVIVFAAADAGGVFRVPASGGSQVAVTSAKPAGEGSWYRFPSFLPDGRRFLVSVYPSNEIWLGSIDSSTMTRLFAADSQAQATPSGEVFFVRQGTLLAQRYDFDRTVALGEAVPIEASVMSDLLGFHAFSVSRTGHLAYRSGRLIEPTQLTWVDRAGRVVGLAGRPGVYRNPALSGDGSRVAVEVVDPATRTTDIWLLDLARGVLARFTADGGVMPAWSPDNAYIAFASGRLGNGMGLYRKMVNGSRPEELLVAAGAPAPVPYSWSPDGRFILHRHMNGAFYNTGLLPMFGERVPRVYAARSYILAFAQVSPDGRSVAYNANDSGRFEVFIDSFPTPGERRQVSTEGGVHPRWRRDGREVYYYATDGRLMAAPIGSGSASPVGMPVPLFQARLLGGPSVAIGVLGQYDVAADGRFLLNVPLAAETPPAIHVALNGAVVAKR